LYVISITLENPWYYMMLMTLLFTTSCGTVYQRVTDHIDISIMVVYHITT